MSAGIALSFDKRVIEREISARQGEIALREPMRMPRLRRENLRAPEQRSTLLSADGPDVPWRTFSCLRTLLLSSGRTGESGMRFSTSMTDGAPRGIAAVAALAAAAKADLRSAGARPRSAISPRISGGARAMPCSVSTPKRVDP